MISCKPLRKELREANTEIADQALAYCLKHELYRATDFTDATLHFMEKQQRQMVPKLVQSDLKLLAQVEYSQTENQG